MNLLIQIFSQSFNSFALIRFVIKDNWTMIYTCIYLKLYAVVYCTNMSAGKNKMQDNYPPINIYPSRWLKYPNKPAKESRKTKRHFSDRKDHLDFLFQFCTAYGDQGEERDGMTDEEKARDQHRLAQLTLTPKQVVKNRQKMQDVAFDNLSAIMEEENYRKAQQEQKRHARAAEKDKAIEAERKKQMREKRKEVVEMRNFNAHMMEKKRQRDQWEKQIRNDWVVSY